MKFTVSTAKLAAAVKATSIAVMTKSTIPVLAGVRLAPVSTGIELAAYDLDTSAQVLVEPDGLVGDEPALVSHALLSKVLQVATAKYCTVEVVERQMLVTAGRASWQLPLMLIDEFPNLPAEPTLLGRLDADEFAAAAAGVAEAAADLEGLANLQGVWFEPMDGAVTLAATDRYRAHVAHLAFTMANPLDVQGLLIPAPRALQLSRLIGDGEVTVRGGLRDGLFGIESGHLKVTTRLLDDQNGGRWINWTQLVERASDVPSRFTIDRDELSEALRQATAVSAESRDHQLVMLTVTESEVAVALSESDGPSGSTVIDGKLDGRPLKFVINAGFLLAALAGVPPEVEIAAAGPTRLIGVGVGSPAERVVQVVRSPKAGWLD